MNPMEWKKCIRLNFLIRVSSTVYKNYMRIILKREKNVH